MSALQEFYPAKAAALEEIERLSTTFANMELAQLFTQAAALRRILDPKIEAYQEKYGVPPPPDPNAMPSAAMPSDFLADMPITFKGVNLGPEKIEGSLFFPYADWPVTARLTCGNKDCREPQSYWLHSYSDFLATCQKSGEPGCDHHGFWSGEPMLKPKPAYGAYIAGDRPRGDCSGCHPQKFWGPKQACKHHEAAPVYTTVDRRPEFNWSIPCQDCGRKAKSGSCAKDGCDHHKPQVPA